MTARILPPNATPLERAVAEVAAARLDDLYVPLEGPWSAQDVPEPFLPWLAWEWSVDQWDPLWSEDQKRHAVASSIGIHRIKGSVASVIMAIEALGYGVGELIEGWANARYDGAITYDGTNTHASSDHWAEYRVKMAQPISLAQAETIRRVLTATAPARSRLKHLDFTAVANIHDGTIRYDGSYTYGVA